MSLVVPFLLLGLAVVVKLVMGASHKPFPVAGEPVNSSPEPEPDPDAIRTLLAQPLVQELPSPCPNRFRWAVVAGRDAMAAIPALDALGAREGWVAVFVGDGNELPEFHLHDDAPDELLDLADRIDVPAWFALREQERREDRDEELDPAQAEAALLGDWPDEDSEVLMPLEYTVLKQLVTGPWLERVCIALVPVRDAWQAPAYLQNGSWNACPDPAEQVAVLRYWHQQHGARLRCFSRDVMEFEVAAPPQGREAAMHLAREQYNLCNDLVEQGCGALRPLADTLERSPRWYFWWD